MSFPEVLRFVITLVLMTGCLLLNPSIAQEKDAKSESTIITPKNGRDDGLRKEIEPGVVVYGKSHRFSEVGQCQGFDSSPDGRTLAFASNKLKFFDLRENRVTDEIGEPGESYSSVAYSPDGRNVFAQTHKNGNTVIRVFDAIDLSSIGTISTKKDDSEKPGYFYVQSICVSADGHYVALASHNELQVRNVRSGELIGGLDKLGYVQGMAFSLDESELYISKMGQLVVLDLQTGEPKKKSDSKLVGQNCSALDINLSRNLLALPQSSIVTLYDLEQGKSIGTISLPKLAYGQSVQFSDDGSLIAVNAWQQDSGTSRMVVIIANVDTKQVIKTIKVPSQGITRLRFSSDNKNLLVSGHSIYGVLEISIENDDALAGANYPVGPAKTALFHPDGNSFLTCTQGGEVTWFETSTGKVLRSIQKANLRSAELTEDGSGVLLVSQWGNSDGITRVSYKNGKPEKSYASRAASKKGSVFSQIRRFMTSSGSNFSQHSQSYAMAAKLSEDGSELNSLLMEMTYHAVPSVGGTSMEQEMSLRFVKMDTESGKRLEFMKVNPEDLGFSKNEWVQNSAIRSDGMELAIPRSDTIYVVDTQTGESIGEYMAGENNRINSVEYSPNGRFLAAAGHQGVWIWDAVNGKVVKTFEGQGAQYFGFSKDGSRLAVCSRKSYSPVEVYSTDSWKKIVERKKTQADRNCVVLSNDGQKLLIGLADCRVEIWDLARVGK